MMKQEAKHDIDLYNLDQFRKVHVRSYQYQMRKEGACDGPGENGFPPAPWCKRVETD